MLGECGPWLARNRIQLVGKFFNLLKNRDFYHDKRYHRIARGAGATSGPCGTGHAPARTRSLTALLGSLPALDDVPVQMRTELIEMTWSSDHDLEVITHLDSVSSGI